MDLNALVKAARVQLDATENGGNNSVDLWSDETLELYANRAQIEACYRSPLLLDSTTTEVCTIDVLTGTHTYDLSDKILAIRRATILDSNGEVLMIPQIGRSELDNGLWGSRYSTDSRFFNTSRRTTDYAYRWESLTGEITHYVLDMNARSIRLFRIPEADNTLALTVERLPLADMALPTDTPEIDPSLHYYLIDWIRHLAYQVNDIDTEQGQVARMAEESFTANFGRRDDHEWQTEVLRGRSREARAYFV